jgi:uncharacterized membrane protein
MDNSSTDNKSDSIIVTLGSSEYTIPTGTSAEIVVFLANPSLKGDYFKVMLLGIPPSWITSSGPPAVWVPAGGQEKVILTVRPPAMAETVTGSYFARLQVFNQSTPEKGKELEIILKIIPETKSKATIQLRTESTELKAIPGIEVKIPLTVNNLSQEADFVELSVQGVPTSWVSLPSPVITLYAGEQKRVELILQIPATPEIRAGYIPLKISAFSQKDPSIKDEVGIMLVIAAFESLGRVGVMMSSVHFSVAPGSSLTIPITALNRGLEGDAFRLGVEGIPVSWVSTSAPVIPVEPGETKEITLVVRPPLTPSSQSGRYKFFILVASQKTPELVVKVDCILTVAAYVQFSAELQPREVKAGQPVRVGVKNEGNIQQVFHLSCASQNDQLLFEFLQPEGVKVQVKQTGPDSLVQKNENISAGNQSGVAPDSQPPSSKVTAGEQTGDPTVLPLPPGESGAFRFSARPRQRKLIGGAVSYPYHVTVKAQQQEAPLLNGKIIGQGNIPVWVLPIVLILCVSVFFVAVLLNRRQAQTGTATQTYAAETTLTTGASQTYAVETTLTAGATQTIAANQTAAAIAGQLDSDGDGLTDQQEAELGTNPYNPDTDGDKSWDGVEVQQGTNPINPDTDSDGLLDGNEVPPCSDPLNPDSDGDGIIDGKDLDPCDANNPALTATAVSLLPTSTTIPPTATPTETPIEVTPSPTSVSLPRFGGVILFESDRDGNPEIYVLDDAGHINRMTDNPSSDTQAAWDPSMQRIAFTTNRDGQNEIYLMNADGTNPINLTNNPADDQQPSWSVDGQWIAFTSNREGNYEIYILHVNGPEVINLTNNPGNDAQPNWVRSTTFDPSGESIVFTSDRDGNQEIYRMKTDGSEVTNLTGNPASDQLAKGSPDGALVVFTTNRDGNQEIYSMRIDGLDQMNQTNNPANDFGPSWAPSQAWIAFTTDRDGNREVYIIKPGVVEVYNITNHPNQDQISDWR